MNAPERTSSQKTTHPNLFLDLTIANPEKVLYQGKASSVTAPGSLGYLQILINHAPLMTPLISGTVKVQEASGTTATYPVKGGLLEVAKNQVSILLDF